MTTSTTSPLLAAPGSRLCGSGRQSGELYLTCGLAYGGSAIESLLMDLPMQVDAEEMGLSAIGIQTFMDPNGVTHVLDWVGEGSYPEVVDFAEECLLGEEMIATEEGVKAIRDLRLGDLVVTHRGRLRAVTDLIENIYQGDLVEVRTAFTNQVLKLTPLHPVFAKSAHGGAPRFVEAREVREGDWLCFPRPQRVTDITELTLTYTKRYKHFASSVRTADLERRVQMWVGNTGNLSTAQRLLVHACAEGQTLSALRASEANTYAYRPGFARAVSTLVARGFLLKQEDRYVATARGIAAAEVPRRTAMDVARRFGVRKHTAHQLMKPRTREHQVSRSVEVNAHLMTLIGYYLAEGSTANTTPGKPGEVQRNVTEYSFGKAPKELQHAEDVVAAAQALGFPAKRGLRDGCYRVLVHSRHLAEYLRGTFGGHATQKRIPQWVIDLPIDKLEVLLNTYLNGDGYRRGNISVGTTASPHLAHGLRSVALKLGHRAGISMAAPVGIGKHPLYRVNIASGKPREAHLDDQYQYVRVQTIRREAVDTTVYNVTVAEDESYCTMHHALHNCRRQGISRKISHTAPIEGLSSESRLYLLHPRAVITNAATLPTPDGFACPCGHGHSAQESCIGLAWHAGENAGVGSGARKLAQGKTYPVKRPLEGSPEFALGVFMVAPITALTLIAHPDADVQAQREARARSSALPVFVTTE
jgi:intein/homing endonuclease